MEHQIVVSVHIMPHKLHPAKQWGNVFLVVERNNFFFALSPLKLHALAVTGDNILHHVLLIVNPFL